MIAMDSGRIVTHFRPNNLVHIIYWKSPISILGYVRLYHLDISLEKIAKVIAHSGDPDETPHSAVSDLGLHCLPVTPLMVSRLEWVNCMY